MVGKVFQPTRDAAQAWQVLDERIQGWWDDDVATATAADVADDPAGTLLELPYPYVTAGGSQGAFPEMYGWDTAFINLALTCHGRHDLVAGHLRNQLHQIRVHGMVLNGNRSYYLTRSQPPLLADSLLHHLDHVDDPALIEEAVPALTAEHDRYWLAPHHLTRCGLSTNRDLGDPRLRPELAAEAETGTDFTATFAGDVRRWVPLVTNCALVRTEEVLAELCRRSGRASLATYWMDLARQRAGLIRDLCWDPDHSTFYEYDHVDRRRGRIASLQAYWTMWAGVATEKQAERLVADLDRFRGPHGLACTERPHTSPHPEFHRLQWDHPSGWPPLQMMVVAGLLRYGYQEPAQELAAAFVDHQVDLERSTGSLWERYDVISGDLEALPVERYPTAPMHGWSSAAVTWLGRTAYTDQPVPTPRSPR